MKPSPSLSITSNNLANSCLSEEDKLHCSKSSISSRSEISDISEPEEPDLLVRCVPSSVFG